MSFMLVFLAFMFVSLDSFQLMTSSLYIDLLLIFLRMNLYTHLMYSKAISWLL